MTAKLFATALSKSMTSRRTDIVDDLRFLYPMSWMGTKIRLLNDIESHLPNNVRKGEPFRYIEPFLGGGSVLFRFLYRSLVDGSFGGTEFIAFDNNPDLLILYTTLRRYPDKLLTYLSNMQHVFNGLSGDKRELYYYQVRDRFDNRQISREFPVSSKNPEFDLPCSIKDSARFLFITETGYGRRIEYTKQGNIAVSFNLIDYKQNNKPVGFRYGVLRRFGSLIESARIGYADFEASSRFMRDDYPTFCYLDPPYVKVTKNHNVTRYGASVFGLADQERLSAFMKKRSCEYRWIMMSNAAHKDAEETIDRLFSQFYRFKVMVNRQIGSIGKNNGELDMRMPEYLVTTYAVNNRPKTLFGC